MDRVILGWAALIAIGAPAAASTRPVVISAKQPQGVVVACLADQIRQFDNPNIGPSANGAVSITTRVMHVTRINLLVTGGDEVTVEVRNRMSKKLKRIIDDCV